MTNIKIRKLVAGAGLILVAGMAWACGKTILEKEIQAVALTNCEARVVPSDQGPMVFTVIRDCTVAVIYEDDTRSEKTVSDTFDVVGPGGAGEGGGEGEEGEGGGTG